jgi:prefoldin subunit 5
MNDNLQTALQKLDEKLQELNSRISALESS